MDQITGSPKCWRLSQFVTRKIPLQMFCFIKCIINRKHLHKGTEMMYKKAQELGERHGPRLQECHVRLFHQFVSYFCFVACYRSGLWFSETTWLCSAFTQRPSYPSKRRDLQPQPRRHLRLTPHCVGKHYLSSRVGLKDSPNCWNALEQGTETKYGGWVRFSHLFCIFLALPPLPTYSEWESNWCQNPFSN